MIANLPFIIVGFRHRFLLKPPFFSNLSFSSVSTAFFSSSSPATLCNSSDFFSIRLIQFLSFAFYFQACFKVWNLPRESSNLVKYHFFLYYPAFWPSFSPNSLIFSQLFFAINRSIEIYNFIIILIFININFLCVFQSSFLCSTNF